MKGTAPASLATPDISPPSTSAEILPSKQSTPDTESASAQHKPTKPILKNRNPDYSAQGRRPARDGNWYTNPLDNPYYHHSNYHHQVRKFIVFSYSLFHD